MMKLEPGSIDMILTDLPYGRTQNAWDSPLPIDELWRCFHHVIKPNGAICLFCDGMFMADLMTSNRREWRYNLVWDKVLKSGFLNAKRMPLRQTEEIAVFYAKQPTYNPQKVHGQKNHGKGKAVGTQDVLRNNNYGSYVVVDNAAGSDMKYPSSLLTFSKPHPSVALHATEKPTALLEWLINTYTNDGETVLDATMGSGSTGVACINTGRHFVGIENDEEIFETAMRRIGGWSN